MLPTRSRRLPWLDITDSTLAGAVILLGAWCLWAIGTQDRLFWVDLIFDDGYYYLGIARNIVENGRSSFLPPFETNGYQPLWLLLLSLTGWVFGTGERALAMQMVGLTMAFVLLFALASRHYHGRAWPAFVVSAAFPGVMTFGLETVMLPSLVLVFLRVEAWWLRGAVASAIFLTRLDALALIVMRDAHAVFFKREKPSGAGLMHWALLAPVIATYFCVNWLWFGTPVPVSGLAKAVGNVFGQNVLPWMLHPYSARFALAAVLAMWLARHVSRRAVELRFNAEIAILLMTGLACAGYYGLMSGWWLWDWYYWPALLLSYYATIQALDMAGEWSTASGVSRATKLLLALPVAAMLVWMLRVDAGTASRYARVMREVANQEVSLWSFGRKNAQMATAWRAGQIPAGTTFAMGDRAGSMGYFLGNGYRFIHTEGLVGPYEYLQAMRRGAGGQFIAHMSVDYLVVEREKYFETEQVIGVVEPVQGWSVRTGPYMLCFDKAGIVERDVYDAQTRLVIDFRRRVECPVRFGAAFEELRTVFGGVRRFSLPSDADLLPIKWLSEPFIRHSPGAKNPDQ